MRTVIALALGLPLALLAGLQALSSVLTYAAPDLAVTIFPLNGLAREHVAFARFRESAGEGVGKELSAAARAARDDARAAMATDPLVPKAHVVMALASEPGEGRARILDLASRFNRRDLALQGLVIEQGLEAGDFPRTIETLDQILRVHPEYRERFFPILLDALAQPEGMPVFAEMLDGSATWQERFLSYAVRRKAARPALAQLRGDIDFMDDEFDAILISGLASQGEVALARELYSRFAASESEAVDEGTQLSWASDYPPFEWDLSDRRYVRAQPSLDGERLEIFVQSGHGGLVARRIVDARRAPFTILTSYAGSRPVREDSVRLELTCLGQSAKAGESTIEPGRNRMSINALPPDCSQLVIDIRARALRGEPALRFELEPIRFVAPGIG